MRQARRQPGSTLKPFVLLEAFASCGGNEPLFPSRRVVDRPLTIELPSGPWSPKNSDGTFRETVSVRQSLALSLNVPLVRIARHCGLEATADRARDAGLPVPVPAPPSFVLGAVEVNPLELAGAYAAFARRGRAVAPRPYNRLRRPSGNTLAAPRASRTRVAGATANFLVLDLLQEAVEQGTSQAARSPRLPEAFGKTGTSSSRRDAWFAGGTSGVVTAVWVGLDDNSSLGFSGAEAAAPIWKTFMEKAAAAYPGPGFEVPSRVVESWVDAASGLRLARARRGAEQYLFDRQNLPPRKRWWRSDRALETIQ